MTDTESFNNDNGAEVNAAAADPKVDLLSYMILRGQLGRSVAARRTESLTDQGGGEGEYEPVDPGYLQARMPDSQPPSDAP